MPSNDPNLIPVDNPVLGMIDAAAERYGVDRNLAHVVAQMESNYNPQAVSKAGAQGVMQLMPATARGLGVTDSLDPAQNIDGGVKYLAQLSDRYGGDPRLVLAAYNAGPGAVDRSGGVPNYPETQKYVTVGSRKLGSDLSADPNLTPVPAVQATVQTRPQPSVEVLPPLSEPPGGKPAPPEKSVKGFLDNVATGMGRILEPLADPAGTLENVTNLIQGMSEKSGFSPVMGQPKAQVVDAIVNLYKHRYGSLEGFKNAFYDDPVGIAGDVATVFSGAGLGMKAAQDFLEASGITQHAADIAKIAPEAAVGTAATGAPATRVQAGIQGAVDALGKRYKEVVQAGMEKAPSGVLGGPHGMLSTAKYGAARKAGQILKEGWQAGTAAYDGPAAEEAAAAATPAAAPAVAKTPGQVYAESQGHDWASLSANDRQLMEQIAQAQANVAAQPPPQQPPAPPPAAPAAPPLTPQELTQLETGRPPSRQSEAAQQAAAETLATAQAAAPQAAPVAPEAPAPTPEPPAAPVEPEAPQVPQPAAAVQKLTDYVIGKKIAPHMIDKLPPEYWQWMADDAGTPVPTEDQIAQIKANVEAKGVGTPVQEEQKFQQQKARIEGGMTPAQEPQAGMRLEPLPEDVPPHYQGIQQVEGTSAATRAFLKDKRIADYVLGKGITPEEFEAMPLEQQNKLIREAPAASAKGKNRPFLPKPEGATPRAVGRYADEGIRDIVNTMRWRQTQTPEAVPAAPEAAALPPETAKMTPAEAFQEQINALHAERIRHEAEMERRYGPGWRQPQAAAIPTEGVQTPTQAEAVFEAEKAKPVPVAASGHVQSLDPRKLQFTETGQDSEPYVGDPSKPILVYEENGQYHVIDGHHRTQQAIKNGTQVNAIVMPADVFREFQRQGIHQAEMKLAYARKLRAEGKLGPIK